MKGFDENGFKFYTNYDSRKGKDLVNLLNLIIKNYNKLSFQEENPVASMCFYWPLMSRSVNF